MVDWQICNQHVRCRWFEALGGLTDQEFRCAYVSLVEMTHPDVSDSVEALALLAGGTDSTMEWNAHINDIFDAYADLESGNISYDSLSKLLGRYNHKLTPDERDIIIQAVVNPRNGTAKFRVRGSNSQRRFKFQSLLGMLATGELATVALPGLEINRFQFSQWLRLILESHTLRHDALCGRSVLEDSSVEMVEQLRTELLATQWQPSPIPLERIILIGALAFQVNVP